MGSAIGDSPIKLLEEEYPENEVLESLHPFVREWFVGKFRTLSPPQRYSVLNIKRRRNTLISSPTGSGKTLSAFLAILDHLVDLNDKAQLEDRVYAIYVSPLKALANDITKNLKEPLAEIALIAKRYGRELRIRVGSRTGDTTPSQKRAMLEKPPHLLITTPESLAISLASKKFSTMIAAAEFLVVDEVHALADNKRGTHLSLSLEHLEQERVAATALTRIGLSATVRPLEEVAQYLVGMQDPALGVPRACDIVDVTFLKQLDLKVLSPVKDLVHTTHERMQEALYALLHDLIQNHRTTLIFTNTRAGTERVVHHLKERYPRSYTGILDADLEDAKLEDERRHELPVSEESAAASSLVEKEIVPVAGPKNDERGFIGAHHGSLSKRHRLNIENRLREGKLKAVVCSTSLELGIDIGYVDLVVLLGSPKSVARGLQRIGRSGHKLHDVAKGRIIVLDRDDLVECAVLLKAAVEKKIDRIMIPKNPLDVLAQQIYGLVIEKQRHKDELYTLLRRAYPYATLSLTHYEAILTYLAGEYVGLERRHVYGKIWYDKETGMIGRRGKLARLIYMTNVGTIPDETSVVVKIGDLVIGTITEDFLERLKAGDVFVLGGEAYEFRYSRGLTAQVKTSAGRPPTVPQWVSEMLPLSFELAQMIATFRQYLNELFTRGTPAEEIKGYIDRYLYVDDNAVDAIYQYVREQFEYSIIPHRRRIVIEHLREGSRRYAIVHTLVGRRTNDVLARALAFAHGRATGRDVELGISDNGFYLKSTAPISARRLLSLVRADDLRRVMALALEKSEVLAMRFRHCAARSLLILRRYGGESRSVGRQHMSSRLLFSAVRGMPVEFPILAESRREVLEDLMDVRHAEELLREIQSGAIAVEESETRLPSPFALTLVLQGYTDLLKMEDRVAFLARMHEMIVAEIAAKKTGGRVEERFALPTVEQTYERLWDAQEERERLKREDVAAYLKDELRRAANKTRLEPDLVFHAQRLLDNERGAYPEKFTLWLTALLSGTIPRAWSDDLVKALRAGLARL